MSSLTELHAALLQATITAGLAVLCALLYRRYRKPYFFWWAVAWALYLGRLAAIFTYLAARDPFWLFTHQMATGWTALALLWGALVFSRGARFRRIYLLAVLFPPLWSAYAIYHFQERGGFMLAAVPAVAFLSGATLWTAGVFFRFRRQTGSSGALLLGCAFLLWGFHHLDYPILRAMGTWNPWGYYLDILFLLSVGVGIVTLVIEDFERGLGAMAAISGELQRGQATTDAPASLLGRALVLPGVSGSALYERAGDRFVQGVGACDGWGGQSPTSITAPLIKEAVEFNRPVSSSAAPAFEFIAVLPVEREQKVMGALVLVGDARDPFTALNVSFLHALGQQVGAALANAELNRRLRRRTEDLEVLSARMLRQQEEERRRISLELHDETAQVFSAVKLQLGIVREEVPPPQAERLGRVLDLVDEGMASIRSVTMALRPSLLDDLGLLPAIRALATEFETRTGITASISGVETLPEFSEDAELALFRGVQEGLSNVARHAEASRVTIEIGLDGRGVAVTLADNGDGIAGNDGDVQLDEGTGLAGMRERFTAQGGRVALARAAAGGLELRMWLPTGNGTSDE
ncbi:MAG: histidine kinase [Gemmatimonadales bacterium]